VRNCTCCQRFKVSQQQIPGKMLASPVHRPWQTVSVDLVGPLPRSTKGNNFLVVFQDRFTKWTACKPIRNATAKAVSQALREEIITRFGCPISIISDNGTQFTSNLFTSLLKDFGIQHRLTPTYTPQCNPVERANRTIKTMISQFCEKNHRQWDQDLPELTFAMNTSRHESTGYTPAFLNFWRELDAASLIHPESAPPDADDNSPLDISTHTERLQKMKEIHDFVKIRLARAFNRQSHYYNLRRRDWRCKIGDLVMKREHPLSKASRDYAAKLAPKYSGPYTITRVISPVMYDLKDSNGKRFGRVHIKDLKSVTN